MSQENQITLRGFITAEPKFRQTANMSAPVTEIRVGSTPRRLNRETGEWQDLPTSYFTVKCWRRLAVNAVGSLHKGDMVVVRGRFTSRHWVDNQQRPRTTIEIEADSLGHDLAYGWSHFLRGTQARPASQVGINAGEVARQDLEAPGADGDDSPYPEDDGWDEATAAAPVPDGAGDLAETGGDDGLAGSGRGADVSAALADAVPF
jgi:single-strand DNA-binding protein